jgi:hypothetical protein
MTFLNKFQKISMLWWRFILNPNTYFLTVLSFVIGIGFFIYADASGELASASAIFVVIDVIIYQVFRTFLGAWTAVAALALVSGLFFGGVAVINGNGFWVYGLVGALSPIPVALFLFFVVGVAKGITGTYHRGRSIWDKGRLQKTNR